MDIATILFSIFGGIVAIVILLWFMFPWLQYDLRQMRIILPIAKQIKIWVNENQQVIDKFESKVKKHPEKTFLIFEGQHYTYRYVDEQCNKVAHMSQTAGWRCGDVVVVFLYNGPEYVWTLLGLMKAGVQTTLVNHNLRSKSLQHCIQVVPGVKAIIVGNDAELSNAVSEIYPLLPNENRPPVYQQGELTSAQIQNDCVRDYDELFKAASESSFDRTVRAALTYTDNVCFVYTSGTTGLPKAARVSHLKVMKACALSRILGVEDYDTVYTALPLYHGTAMMGLTGVMDQGATIVLKKKFSASQFWPDCRKYNVTAIQYVGECMRYLLSQPKSDMDKQHSVRLAFGNGLRKDIFSDFQQRFGIKFIREFYGASEGNVFMANVFNKPGCVGRISPLLSALTGSKLIKYNTETEEAVRDSNGRCIPVKQGETGLLVMKIKKFQEFKGYVGKKELSEKKTLRNVFKEGDAYFNSGDTLFQDEDYFVYFSDRIGDTFRWKGENVSTIEVGNVITELDWVEDANVYGVEVPGHDGKCGMASLTLTSDTLAVLKPDDPEIKSNQGAGQHRLTQSQLGELYSHCEAILPAYARPKFIRIEKEPIVNSTFKHQKVGLSKEGFDPEKCKGAVALYCMSPKDKTYVDIDSTLHENILNGQIRL